MTARPRTYAASVALLVALVTPLAACGSDGVEVPPRLADRLVAVDDAVVARDWNGTREAVDALTRATDNARAAGEIDDERAEEILAAAERLVDGLPEETAEDRPTEEPSTTPTPSIPGTGSREDESDEERDEAQPDESREDEDKAEKEREQAEREAEKEREKAEREAEKEREKAEREAEKDQEEAEEEREEED